MKKVENHNHPEANVVFTVVKGKVAVQLNQEEEHVLTPGTVLQFNGDNFISSNPRGRQRIYCYFSAQTGIKNSDTFPLFNENVFAVNTIFIGTNPYSIAS